MFENINSKLENLSFSVKNQLSFNKMIETQIAQIAAAIPINHSGKIQGQPENFRKNVNAAQEDYRKKSPPQRTVKDEPSLKVISSYLNFIIQISILKIQNSKFYNYTKMFEKFLIFF